MIILGWEILRYCYINFFYKSKVHFVVPTKNLQSLNVASPRYEYSLLFETIFYIFIDQIDSSQN